MSRESSEKESGNRIGLILAVVAALALYILSPLPVVMAMERWFGLSMAVPPDNWCVTAINVVYFPLILADQHLPLVRDFYEYYGKLIGYP